MTIIKPSIHRSRSNMSVSSPTSSSFLILLKPRSRKHRSVLWLSIILLIQLIFFSIYTKTSENFKQLPFIQLPQLQDGDFSSSSHFQYNHMIDSFESQHFNSNPLQYKILLYFNSLYKYNPNWSISNLSNLKYYQKLALESDFKEYYKKRCESEWTRLNVKDSKERQKICSVIRSTILNNWQQNKLIESEIFNFVGHLKIFNLLIRRASVLFPKVYEIFPDLETRLFPFFTGELPQVKFLSTDVGFLKQDQLDAYSPGSNTLVRLLVESGYQGRGIVFTTNDVQTDNLIRTIKVLRRLENRLPVQIVHRNGELSLESQGRIIDLARDDSQSFPKQDIYFVDITNCIRPEFENQFTGTFMKVLLTIFNSFEEMIFMDNDLVPFVNPEELFHSPGYQSAQAFFFKDRNFQNRGVGHTILKFYKDLLPSKNFDSKYFEIPNLADDYTILRSNFFKNLSRHFVDSGVFVMNKRSHIGGVLVSLHLSAWTPTSLFVYGDKELFWLGQLILGNAVEFSKEFASQLGQFVPYSEITRQICSTKLTHLDNHNHSRILWMNGGLNICNFASSLEQDLSSSYYKGSFKTLQELELMYHQPFVLDLVIVPSSDLQEYTNADHEPVKNWEFRPDMGCDNRVFCTFERFGPLEKGGKSVRNEVVEFSDEEKLYYSEIISIWNS